MPTILSLIKELADSVGLLGEVDTTEEQLRATLDLDSDPAPSPSLGPTVLPLPGDGAGVGAVAVGIRPARCLLALSAAGEVAGFAVYLHNYSTWRGRPGIYLEDLFVRAAERRRGHATRLLAELARRVAGLGGARLDWNVLRSNGAALRFYAALGAATLDEWVPARLEGDALARLAAIADASGTSG